ncbi:MAG: hypothetical protein OEZ41_04825 [Nitrospirota bacterium]|nr:hypothetical protein [Nitrospirota bacterium]MDH5699269.1 hypothetical protein [Nitrospirota bacterium]
MMTRHASPSLLHALRILSTMVLLAFTQGCTTNLKAIQDFANLSAESAQYTTLVDEYLEFPNRQKRYQPPSRYANLDAMAQDRATQKTSLLLRQSILETYMESLGRLAADEVVDNTEELGKLSSALEAQAATNPKEAEAYKKIAGMVTTVAVKRWRQRQLQDLIEQSNAPIQLILGSLQRIVSDGFGGDHQTEEAAIQNYYMTLTMESQDPAGKAALAEWKEFRMSQVHERSEAVQTYVKVLANISDGHQRLFDQRQNLSKKEVLQQVGDSVKDLRTLLETIKKL